MPTSSRPIIRTALAVFVVSLASLAAPCELRVESKSFDAGRVEVGAVIEHRFEVVNDGDRPIAVTEVQTSCGCTAPDYPEVMAAGAREFITLEIDTKKLKPGRHSKSATVQTDADDAPRFVLQVKMELYAPLEFLPRSSIYMAVPARSGGEQRVLARPHRAGMEVVNAESDNDKISASVVASLPDETGREGVPAPREGDSWVVIALSPEAPVGLHRGKVTVRTSDPSYPEGVIAVNAVVKEQRADEGR
ncbi:MAG: DUF1573 domain-containing protein [Acidobacteriota bacterium]|nr:DUF1573 domain-containing protein [Acidobacteriota bacterium]